jgi:hypothetical protein
MPLNMPLTKDQRIIAAVALIVIALVAIGLAEVIHKRSENRAILQTQTAATPKMEVATDPNFKEVEGQLVDGFPAFPVYPGATLEASSTVNREDQVIQGYRALWISHDAIPKIARWYETELRKAGWQVTPNDDPNSDGEQVIKIARDSNDVEYTGYVAPEMEGDRIEIVVDLRMD